MLRGIIVEDSRDDFELLRGELRRGGCDAGFELVATPGELAAAIARCPPDFIVADYLLEGATALDALEVWRGSRLDIPFIVVSGSVGEDIAVGAMRAGAHDYVMKSNLRRLAPSLERELREAAVRRSRRDAQDALLRSEDQVRMLMEVSTEGIYGVDTEGRCTFANAAAARLLGVSAPSQVLGGDMHSLTHHSLANAAAYPVDGCPLHGPLSTRGRTHMGEDLFWKLDGSSFPVECWVQPVWRDSVQVASVVTFQDITARKRLEQEMRQAQKMEALGRLAGGVAHDFNNLLTVMNGYSDMLLLTLGERDPSRESVAEIRNAGERAAGLTRQLLSFSRRRSIEMRPLDVAAVVEEFESFLRRLLAEDIELATVLTPGLKVMADAGQIEQMIMNLAVNACDAMAQGGRLEIKTEPADGQVLLTVTDTGCGMEQSVLEQVFEPFFTTKAIGQGTGLGLSTVHGVVAQMGGSIKVESRLGVGTSFRIHLPRIKEEEKVREGAAAAPRAAAAGTETVLVVEDQAEVRRLIKVILARKGYRVVEAASAAEALAACETSPGQIGLVLTDVIMPLMNGRELAQRLRVMRPGIRVVLMSGYTADLLGRRAGMEKDMVFLEKPFTPDALLAAVRAGLDAPAQTAAGR